MMYAIIFFIYIVFHNILCVIVKRDSLIRLHILSLLKIFTFLHSLKKISQMILKFI